MTYQTTITQKGQVVVPKEIRDRFLLKKDQKILVDISEKEDFIILRPAKDVLDMAGSFNPQKVVSALSARQEFENKYERR